MIRTASHAPAVRPSRRWTPPSVPTVGVVAAPSPAPRDPTTGQDPTMTTLALDPRTAPAHPGALVRKLAARRELWAPHVRFDPTAPRSGVVWADDRHEAVITSWLPGTGQSRTPARRTPRRAARPAGRAGGDHLGDRLRRRRAGSSARRTPGARRRRGAVARRRARPRSAQRRRGPGRRAARAGPLRRVTGRRRRTDAPGWPKRRG